MTGLVGDIGGTHARFGLLGRDGEVSSIQSLTTSDYPSLEATARAYLETVEPEVAPAVGAIAVAGPVSGDVFELTNLGWKFSVSSVRQALELERLVMLNDFQALALAVPFLDSDDLDAVRPGEAVPGQALAVLGPGTGLGVSGAIPVGDRWAALRAEGGHRDLAASTELEWEVVKRLAVRFGGHVSAERAVSGSGLVNLYETLGEIEGVEHAARGEVTARQIDDLARQGDARAEQAIALFCGWLGAIAGDLALTLGARGGVYLGGGLLAKMGEMFDRQRFEERFLAKGRFRGYLEPIPVWLIRRRAAALLGAAHVLRFPLHQLG